jgi:hypothetical protein
MRSEYRENRSCMTRNDVSHAGHRVIIGPLSAMNRFAAAIIGGYLFAYGFTALATLAGFRVGLPYSEAQVLAWMLGAFVYLGAILWGFVPRSTMQAWFGLAGSGAAMGAAAWILSRWAA